MNLRVAIAGHRGFIGQHLCDSLQSRSITFLKLERENLDNPNYLKNEQANVLVNLAGLAHGKYARQHSEKLMQANCGLALSLLRLAKSMGIKRYIYMSSIAVLGDFTYETPFTNESTANPLNAYAYSKACAEDKLTETAADLGIELVIIRPPMVYGPKSKGTLKQLDFLIRKLHFFPLPAPTVKRDFVSVYNLVDFLILCLDHAEATRCKWVICDKHGLALDEFMRHWANIHNIRLRFLPLPKNWITILLKGFGLKGLYQKLYTNLFIDASTTSQVLGWEPKYSTDKAIKRVKHELAHLDGSSSNRAK